MIRRPPRSTQCIARRQRQMCIRDRSKIGDFSIPPGAYGLPSRVTLQNQRALGLFTASQRVVPLCPKEQCFYVNKSGQVQQNIQDILEFASKIKTLTSFWDSKSWLMSLLLPFMAPLLILILLIFGQMIINLLTKFISSRIETIKLQMIVTEGY